MILQYPTEFTDRRGTEFSMFITDGQTMKINLRGIEFVGNFWELTPTANLAERAKLLFDLNEEGILNCILNSSNDNIGLTYSLKVRMATKVITLDEREINADIIFCTNPNTYQIQINGYLYNFEKQNFEYGLSHKFTSALKIKYIKCCINCKYSSYSPYGNDEYGDLLCFKKCKEAWESVGYAGLKQQENWKKLADRQVTQEAFIVRNLVQLQIIKQTKGALLY